MKKMCFSFDVLKTNGLLCLLMLTALYSPKVSASVNQLTQLPDSINYLEYKGWVGDRKNEYPLKFATVQLENSTLTTVTNSDGEFTFKIQGSALTSQFVFSLLGYQSKREVLSRDKATNRIKMDSLKINLTQSYVAKLDPASLMLEVLKKRGKSYVSDPTLARGFYRESIFMGGNCVSLKEADYNVYKNSYSSNNPDWASQRKVRTFTDTQKLDTLLFGLMGGINDLLMTDLVKNSERLFDPKTIDRYEFNYKKPTIIGSRALYVIDFRQKIDVLEPLFTGTLYVDADSLVLVKAEYSINKEYNPMFSTFYDTRKPKDATVFPKKAIFSVSYVQKNNKWYMNYCRVDQAIFVNWNKKIKNTVFETSRVLLLSDWSVVKNDERWLNPKPEFKVADNPKAFDNSAFFGNLNVVEPDQYIQTAIKKILKDTGK